MAPSGLTATELDERHWTQATRSLTLALEGGAWFLSKLDRLDVTLQVIDAFNDRLRASRTPSTDLEVWDAELYQRLDAIRARITGYRRLVFCLIGANDSRLNYQAAEASVKIAEESRRIAENSKKVAVLIRRDSADVRIIAAVILRFLPGTFVVTFFSISFLDFVNDDGVVKVSSLGLW